MVRGSDIFRSTTVFVSTNAVRLKRPACPVAKLRVALLAKSGPLAEKTTPRRVGFTKKAMRAEPC
jgi:hypothetical protein